MQQQQYRWQRREKKRVSKLNRMHVSGRSIKTVLLPTIERKATEKTKRR